MAGCKNALGMARAAAKHLTISDFDSLNDLRIRIANAGPERCKAVTGTIFSIKPEKDGDFHIRLTLDLGEEALLNAKNTSGQLGRLVVEPVCESPVTQRDTLQEGVCTGFSQTLHPLVGQHVTVIGAYVTDMEHGWNEIHPVTSITVSP